ncbi:MAG TPA: T9SS type A sorting domain-containing protein [Saprospiraceae bacterium]|nr:T9SS type A sorting domain-containing protein [Saprospiraceae bacterium]
MNKIFFATIFYVIWCFTDTTISAQCPKTLSFCSQEDVDSFPSRYRGCHVFDTLYIDFSHCVGLPKDITNLDSLSYIKYVGYLVLNSASDISDVSGLSMNKVDYMEMHMQKKWIKPMKIDTFGRLDINFPQDTVADLKLFEHIKYINGGLTFIDNALFVPPLRFNVGDDFDITVASNHRKNDLKNVMPQKPNSTIHFSFINSFNLNCELDYDLDSIYGFRMSGCDKFNLGSFKKVKYCNVLRFFSQREMGHELEDFQLEDVNSFIVANNRTLLDGSKIFPNLKNIKAFLWLEENDNLENLTFLDNCEIPTDFDFDETLIRIESNDLLETCNSNFLCRAFKEYPNSIKVRGNFNDCNNELILRECNPITSIVDYSENETFIYPNPTSGRVQFNKNMGLCSLSVYNLQGKLVKELDKIESEVELMDLPAGIYFLDLRDNKSIKRYKLIKVD